MFEYTITDEELNYIRSINKPFSQTLWNLAKGNLKRYLSKLRGAWKDFEWEDSEFIEEHLQSPEMKRWIGILGQIKWDENKKEIIDTRNKEDKELTFYELYRKRSATDNV